MMVSTHGTVAIWATLIIGGEEQSILFGDRMSISLDLDLFQFWAVMTPHGRGCHENTRSAW